MRAVGVAGLVVAAIGLRPANAACSVPRIRTLQNQTTAGFMTVSTGTTCHISLRSSTGPMLSADIVQQPSNGKAATSGQRIAYRSRPGFLGADTFSYARRGYDTRNNPVVRTVRVSVTVTP